MIKNQNENLFVTLKKMKTPRQPRIYTKESLYVWRSFNRGDPLILECTWIGPGQITNIRGFILQRDNQKVQSFFFKDIFCLQSDICRFYIYNKNEEYDHN